MGKKFKLSKKAIKARPKKRGKYAEKPHDPKKPRTNDELDDVFPGYKDQSRLARGIIEAEDEAQAEDKPDEDSIPDEYLGLMTGGDDAGEREIAGIPMKWGRMMSNSPSIQCQFNKKLNEVRQRQAGAIDDEDEESLYDAATKDFAKRWAVVHEDQPAFMHHLHFLLEPFLKLEGIIGEGRRRKPVDKALSDMDAEQIQTLCRKRFGLMTLQSLLQLIDQLNKANAGKLNQPQPTS